MEHRVEHRYLYAAAFAGSLTVEQCRKDSLAGKDAAAEIRDRNADAHRRPAGFAGDRHMAADRLNVDVERGIVFVRAGRAKTGDRTLDDAWVDAAQGRVVDLQAFEHAGPKIVDHDVADFHQVVKDTAPGLGLEIDDDALLIAVEGEE